MKRLEYIGQPDWEREIEYMKSKVRGKVEHIFSMLPRQGQHRGAGGYKALNKAAAGPTTDVFPLPNRPSLYKQ
jgi:hypothetical protein